LPFIKDYILSVLSPEERLDATFNIAKEAFKGNKRLAMKDIENTVKRVRRKIYTDMDITRTLRGV